MWAVWFKSHNKDPHFRDGDFRPWVGESRFSLIQLMGGSRAKSTYLNLFSEKVAGYMERSDFRLLGELQISHL